MGVGLPALPLGLPVSGGDRGGVGRIRAGGCAPQRAVPRHRLHGRLPRLHGRLRSLCRPAGDDRRPGAAGYPPRHDRRPRGEGRRLLPRVPRGARGRALRTGRRRATGGRRGVARSLSLSGLHRTPDARLVGPLVHGVARLGGVGPLARHERADLDRPGRRSDPASWHAPRPRGMRWHPPGGAQRLRPGHGSSGLAGRAPGETPPPALRRVPSGVGGRPALGLDLDGRRRVDLAGPPPAGGHGARPRNVGRPLHRIGHRGFQRRPQPRALRALARAVDVRALLPDPLGRRGAEPGAMALRRALSRDHRAPDPGPLPAAAVPVHPGLGGEPARTSGLEAPVLDPGGHEPCPRRRPPGRQARRSVPGRRRPPRGAGDLPGPRLAQGVAPGRSLASMGRP